MTTFERLALQGLWLILKAVLRGSQHLSGTPEISWAKAVAEELKDDKLRNI